MDRPVRSKILEQRLWLFRMMYRLVRFVASSASNLGRACNEISSKLFSIQFAGISDTTERILLRNMKLFCIELQANCLALWSNVERDRSGSLCQELSPCQRT
uniref:Uncharacterized protein n=1 Tax=Vespula pensylvanica TaxID=30213 RepID=A0A834K4B3_VESPE|nr:hypothetical protein H0235_015705 [Vespula pensylvanica]